MMQADESALVVLVPAAEVLVGPYREKYDPSAAAGMPAHITLLYPFVAPDEIGSRLRGDLASLFERFALFEFALTEGRRFPGVFYLAPEPADAFRNMTLAILEAYPEFPPYGGRHAEIVPHLSVAQLPDEQELGTVSDEFSQTANERLPIPASAMKVDLMNQRAGRWTTLCEFPLGTD